MSTEPATAVDADVLMSLSGLELLRLGLTDAPRPPSIGQLLGMRLADVEYGSVTFELTTQPLFSNPLGTVHGGIAATMLDSAMGCAVHTTLEAGAWYATLELKVNYIKAASVQGQTLIATGQTIHVGRSTATAEGRVVDSEGNLIAHGTTTCLIRR
ncbi:PaaI family thioesterase [Nocardioides sp. URHA0020]|uniref:PaaI family thioesterase n=1 Tax=Nocardioides sp. URHA0020 TaxID=1380392 RepID=UPI000685F600|nr:PaaI family thioesterase [Nocardioides sp. URHA0020]